MKLARIAAAWLAMAATLGGNAAAQMSAPTPMPIAQFTGAAAGQPVQIVVRVLGRKRESLRGELLNRKADGTYSPSGIDVNLYVSDGTPIVMGSATDLVPGGVIFVDGVATKPGNADAKRLIVITAYATVR